MNAVNSVSIVIPVYNSEFTLTTLTERLEPVLETHTSDFEVILVNDGSRDKSWEEIVNLTAKYRWIRGINLLRNYGQHNALLCGIRAAKYELIVTMDDDLQHPPEELSKLFNKISEGFEVVYGFPEKEQHGLWRDLASQVTKFVLRNALGAETARHVSSFRVFREQIRRGFENYQGPFVAMDVLLTWGASKFAATPVRIDPRTVGVSNYSFRKLLTLALTLMTGFTTIPLQLASIMGFGFTLFGFIILIYVVGRYFIQGGSVPGFPFLASIITIFSGAQLFTLGIIGEYLSRMHYRMMDQPTYVVSESIG